MDKSPIDAMRLAPRCGAQTRRGTSCLGAAMANGRCRMHGGNNPGPPHGNRNAWKYGLRSAEMVTIRAMGRSLRESLKSI